MRKTHKVNIGYSLEKISLDVVAAVNSLPNQITKFLARCECPIVFLKINIDYAWTSFELDQVAQFNQRRSSLIDSVAKIDGILLEVKNGVLESSGELIVAHFKSKSHEAFAPVVYETISGKEILLPIKCFPWY